VNKVHASSGHSRLVVIFLLTVIVLAACGLWHWGTAWTVPAAVGIPVRYKFLGYWDGAGSQGGETVYATDLSANRILILAVERQPALQEDGTGKR
jgi:hypothetical protein